jgi:Pyruvate/2-oxoacid:ferredoxin oxidoreductase delta subunit
LEDEPTTAPKLGEKVLVYGGGNTAIDAARTALRLGAKNVKVVYRGAIHQMSAHDTEVNAALSDGIEVLYLRSINSIENDKVFIDSMLYNEESGLLSKSGEKEIFHADSIIFAIGQRPDIRLFQGIEGIQISEKNTISVNKFMQTGIPNIFAGGDVISGQRSITNAIGYGKKAAKNMDAYLRGMELISKIPNETINFKQLNLAYYKKDAKESAKDSCLSNKEIITESSRCFSCGNCFHCDNCYGYCPDNAIIKHPDGSLEINYDYCKGCGMCAAECPCGSIKMI